MVVACSKTLLQCRLHKEIENYVLFSANAVLWKMDTAQKDY